MHLPSAAGQALHAICLIPPSEKSLSALLTHGFMRLARLVILLVIALLPDSLLLSLRLIAALRAAIQLSSLIFARINRKRLSAPLAMPVQTAHSSHPSSLPSFIISSECGNMRTASQKACHSSSL